MTVSPENGRAAGPETTDPLPGTSPPGGQPPATPPAGAQPGGTPPIEQSPSVDLPSGRPHGRSGDHTRLIVLTAAVIVLLLIAFLAVLVLTGGDDDTTATSQEAGAGSVVVPDLIGLPGKRALETLHSLGLSIGEPSAEPSTEVPAGNVMDQTPAAGATVAHGAAVDLVFSHGAVPFVMPDVVGQTEEDATATLEAAGLVPTSVDSYDASVAEGTVIAQGPEAGGATGTGMVVSIQVSRGASGDAGAVTVPDVVGMIVYDGAAKLEGLGLAVQPFYDTETNQPQGTILEQLPAAGSEVAAGSTVQITVSVGPQPPTETTG